MTGGILLAVVGGVVSGLIVAIFLQLKRGIFSHFLKDRVEATKAGRIAFANGVPLVSNPHQNKNPKLEAAWGKGWTQARQAKQRV
jgi:hypothetical protein